MGALSRDAGDRGAVNHDLAALHRLAGRLVIEHIAFDEVEVRVLLELEGLREWRPGRTSGFEQLERAVDLLGLYDQRGAIVDGEYHP